MADKPDIRIVDVSPLNGRSVRLEFNNGAIRLFDSHRLRGPIYIPLTHPETWVKAGVRDGNLYWEELDLTVGADFVYSHSFPYDDNASQIEYVPTKRDKLGERVATILFPLMAIAGIIGTVYWYINN